MSVRLRLALLLGAVAAAVLWRREILRVLRAWEQRLERLFQTELEAYPTEDPTWTIAERPYTNADRQAARFARTKRQMREQTGAELPFGAIWNWVRRSPYRREVHRNGHQHAEQTAS